MCIMLFIRTKNTVYQVGLGFPGGAGDIEPTCQCRRHKSLGCHLLVGKIPWRRAWQSTPVYLPGESPWREEPGRLQSMGSQRVRYNWSTKHNTHPYKNGKYEHRDSHIGRKLWTDMGRGRVTAVSTSQGERTRTDASFTSLWRNLMSWHLYWNFWPPKVWDIKYVLFNESISGILYMSLR